MSPLNLSKITVNHFIVKFVISFNNSLIVSGVSLYYLFESFVVVSLFPIEFEA